MIGSWAMLFLLVVERAKSENDPVGQSELCN
jgi:hypothetical protein